MNEWLKQLFGMANEATEEQLKEKITNVKKTADEKDEAVKALANETLAKKSAETSLQAANSAKSAAETELANEKKAKEEAEKVFSNERKERIELLVNCAIADGRITPADKQKWVSSLNDDFETKSADLANAQKSLKTSSVTDGLGTRSSNTQDRQGQILSLVNEHMEKTGQSYHDSYMAVKNNSKHKGLFEEEVSEK